MGKKDAYIRINLFYTLHLEHIHVFHVLMNKKGTYA